MLISDMQDSLRKITLRRIANGECSGVALAQATGFKEAHVSNFLHGHRNVSIEGFDKFLRALKLSAADLIRERTGKRRKTRLRSTNA
jgi:hypothetical protein